VFRGICAEVCVNLTFTNYMINTRSIVLVALTVLMALDFCPGSTMTLPASSNGPPDFLTAKAYSLIPDSSTGSVDPRSMALGDFNGDGKVDIVSGELHFAEHNRLTRFRRRFLWASDRI